MEYQYPHIWSAEGAVSDAEPEGFLNKLKWRLLRRWFAPEKTVNKKLYQSLVPDGDDDVDIGSWGRFKSYLLKRWLPQIRFKQHPENGIQMTDVEQGLSTSAPASLHYAPGTVSEIVKASTPVLIADAEPTVLQQITTTGLRPLTVPGRRRSSSLEAVLQRHSEDGGRPNSRGSSVIMFEERNLSDSESDTGPGAAAESESSRRGKASQAATSGG